jgi:hypothetical protein
MSIAWSTLVVLVLLLPGFLFFAGLYLPERITPDSAPVSPIGQLAGIVGVAFVLHAGAYVLINGLLSEMPWLGGQIHLPALFAVLRLESPGTQDFAYLRSMFDNHMLRIAVYFAAVSAIGYLAGIQVGRLIESGPLRSFARVPWVFELGSEKPRAGKHSYQLVRAHVLSKTSHNGKSLLYQGIVIDFRVAADGSIKTIVLKNARSALLDISSEAPTKNPVVLPLERDQATVEFLVLGAADIANVYLEKITPVTASDADLKQLDEELRRAEAEQAG